MVLRTGKGMTALVLQQNEVIFFSIHCAGIEMLSIHCAGVARYLSYVTQHDSEATCRTIVNQDPEPSCRGPAEALPPSPGQTRHAALRNLKLLWQQH